MVAFAGSRVMLFAVVAVLALQGVAAIDRRTDAVPTALVETGVKFFTPEHIRIGDSAWDQVKTPLGAGGLAFGTQKLSLGELVALYGDYIAHEDSVGVVASKGEQSHAEEIFKKGFHKLDKLKTHTKLVERLQRFFKMSFKHVMDGSLDGKEDPAQHVEVSFGKLLSEYASENIPFHLLVDGYNVVDAKTATRSAKGKETKVGPMVDHLQPQASHVYEVAHHYAQKLAATVGAAHKKSGAKELSAEHKKQLKEAYAADAAGMHFLTDAFSAGHIRSLSLELFQHCAPKDASILGKAQHDEDGWRGLYVKNDNGDKWRAHGDRTLLDAKSEHNMKFVVDAVKASIDEVTKSFETGAVAAAKKVGMAALKIVPKVDTEKESHPALIRKAADGSLEWRKSPADELKKPVFEKLTATSCPAASAAAANTKITCFKQDKKVYVMAEGDCKRSSILSTCGPSNACQSDTENPCKGECVCGRHNINECKCVKAADSLVCPVYGHI